MVLTAVKRPFRSTRSILSHGFLNELQRICLRKVLFDGGAICYPAVFFYPVFLYELTQ